MIYRGLCVSTNKYSILESRNYQTEFKDVDDYYSSRPAQWSICLHAPLDWLKFTYTRLRLAKMERRPSYRITWPIYTAQFIASLSRYNRGSRYIR